MVNTTAEAQEVLDGVEELIESAAGDGLDLSRPTLWLLVAGLRDCQQQFDD